MATISNRTPPVTVEYDACDVRAARTFADAYAARRFYAAKDKAGKNPSIRVAEKKPAAPAPKPPAPESSEPIAPPAKEGKHIAVYLRVSTNAQDTRSQEPDLARWAAAQDEPVRYYRDKVTSRTMDRPGWAKLEAAIRQGRVSAVVVWQIDRLGRTVKGLTALFEDLREWKVNLVSLRDGMDLTTPAGRLMANVLASVAQYETEMRGERVAAGQAVARAEGKRWGGSKSGVRKKMTPEQEAAVRHLKSAGHSIMAIAKAVGLSRPTVYDVLAAGTGTVIG